MIASRSIFLVFLPIVFSYPLLAQIDFDLEKLENKLSRIQEKAIDAFVIPLPPNRPSKCPSSSAQFSDLAKKIGAIATSIQNRKCYQKHATTIGRLNELGLGEDLYKIPEGQTLEDGSFIESTPQTVINITNNQVQNVQNQQSLVSGLFQLSGDPDCVSELKQNGAVGAIGSAIAGVGAMSMIFPSAAGAGIGAAMFVIGGSMSVIEKLSKPGFDFKKQSDRSEFLALNCAFFNLRNELMAGGFFDFKSSQNTERKNNAESLLLEVNSISNRLADFSVKWESLKIKKFKNFLGNKIKDRNAHDFMILKDFRIVLESEIAKGSKPTDRFSILHHLEKNHAVLKEILTHKINDKIVLSKVLDHLEMFAKLTIEEVLSLERKRWQLVYIEGSKQYIDAILQEFFVAELQIMDQFDLRFDFAAKQPNRISIKNMSDRLQAFRKNVLKLQTDLFMKIRNMSRLEKQTTLEVHGEGFQNIYDIHQQMSQLRDEITGRKGWKFFKYLHRQARAQYSLFRSLYKNWHKKSANAEADEWLCRGAFEIGVHWDSANSAVELAYDFLTTNSDLWTDARTFRQKLFRPLPIASSYQKSLILALKSAESAKKKLAAIAEGLDQDEGLVDKLAPTLNRNLGRTILKIKTSSDKREELETFRQQHCKRMAF